MTMSCTRRCDWLQFGSDCMLAHSYRRLSPRLQVVNPPRSAPPSPQTLLHQTLITIRSTTGQSPLNFSVAPSLHVVATSPPRSPSLALTRFPRRLALSLSVVPVPHIHSAICSPSTRSSLWSPHRITKKVCRLQWGDHGAARFFYLYILTHHQILRAFLLLFASLDVLPFISEQSSTSPARAHSFPPPLS